MERNLHIVQDEQIASLKVKHDALLSEREDLEKLIEDLKKEKE